ncbi:MULTISPECIES: transglycosylase domain-containing protein [Paenibacillus]|uniref:transglycosylase domain-containing protein n=1 Tax=Paenibacillus TaxID=44249 RepID=UPI0022B86780|nr:PBP1A family penicillin-binding protein [Paenibacillus caseinilyticus]MCZ8522911.1 PBP1A family penicillin-binding protein [Paenibacillus caseinilyticus]
MSSSRDKSPGSKGRAALQAARAAWGKAGANREAPKAGEAEAPRTDSAASRPAEPLRTEHALSRPAEPLRTEHAASRPAEPLRSEHAASRPAEPLRTEHSARGKAVRSSAPAETAAGSVPAAAKPKSRKRLLLVAFVGAAAAGVIGLAVAATWVRGLDISKLSHPLPEPGFMLDMNGQRVAQLSSSKLVPVPLAQMPEHLRNAVIAVEDRRFYEHKGFDVWSISRALLRDLRAGSMKEGGSTITQQLAKNLFLESDKTLTRKAKELGYAVKINFTYSKDEILELYLNSIYLGEGRYGVEGAAQQYFGKSVKDLTLEECALLAALPKAPTAYSPVKNPDKALERRNLVLSLMKEQNFISEAAYTAAVAKPIALSPPKAEDSLQGRHAHYVDYVMDEAQRLYGFTEEQVLTMGLRIYTGMDLKVQQAMEQVYATDALFPQAQGDQPVQSGAVVIDHKTGVIKGILGGRGKAVYRGFNRATELKRQPGSSFKPLAVYGPALERGYTPQSVLYDGELDIGGYKPRDWDGQTRGQVSLQEAVMRSWNIPAVWLLNEIGIDAGLDFVKRAGITLPAADRTLSLALGGLSEGVSPLQMAQAYGSIANQGVLHQAHAIVKITTKDGQKLVDAAPQQTTVTTPVNAYILTTLLQNVLSPSGTGQAAAVDGRPTAGKTGTTQLPATAEFQAIGSGGSKDAWFAGFTPELTAAVWVGYDKTDKSHYLTTGSSVPATLFREIMTRSLQGVPVSGFPVPEEIRRAEEEAAARQKAAEEQAAEEQAKREQEQARKQERGKGADKREALRKKIEEWFGH